MRIINAMVRGLASAGISPNFLTAIGVTINIGCGVLFGMGEFFYAGIVLIVVGAVRDAGVRAVLLAGWGGLGGRAAADDIYVAEAMPHDALFPRIEAT